jgi:hypothetical protein
MRAGPFQSHREFLYTGKALFVILLERPHDHLLNCLGYVRTLRS